MLPAAVPPPPAIVRHYIPYPARRKREMRAYARRHYGIDDYRLRAPKVIVEHVAVAGSTSAVFATFAPDVPDVELHELPNVCSHYVVGLRDADMLGNARELRASLRLTRWLRCRFAIAVKNVIGHNESLTSPYHHERVVALRRQTHGDWVHASMVRYRARLRALPCPS